MDATLPLILLDPEMLKISRAEAEAYFVKKLIFVTDKCLAQHAFGKCPRTTEKLLKCASIRE